MQSVLRRCPTLPRGLPRSTIGAEGLNFRVRNGTGCFPFAMAAETLLRCKPAQGQALSRRPSLANWFPTAPREPHSGRKQRIRVEAKPLGLLVPVSCTCYHASTSGLSTRWSSRGPYSIKDGKSHLEAGFPLRCFQRLSLPNVANQQCSWWNNWHTRGSSVPVLSY